MAYREFHNEPYYKDPGIEFLPKTMAMIQTVADTRLRQQQHNWDLAANYKQANLEGKFPADQRFLNDLSQKITLNATNDLMNYGNLSPRTRQEITWAQGMKALSYTQWNQTKDLEGRIQNYKIAGPNPEKNYWDNSHDMNMLTTAAYGTPQENSDKNTEINLHNRAERLNNVGNQMGKNYLLGFKKDAYVQDYVDNLGEQQREVSYEDPTGKKSREKVQAVFWDPVTGKPGVTDPDAIHFLDSSPHIQEYYKQKVDTELLDDARKMMATKEGAWLKDLTPDEVVQKFRENPSLNTESKVTPGQRELQLAKEDLIAKHRIHLANAYDAGNINDDQSARGVSSKLFAVNDAFDRNSNSGPSFVYSSTNGTKQGLPIQIKGKAFDVNSGEYTGNTDAAREMIVKSSSLALFDKTTGKPLPVKFNTTQEMVDYIGKMKPDELANTTLLPVIKGQSFNRANVISNARLVKDKLSVKPDKTQEDENAIEAIDKVLQMADQNPDLAPEVFQSALQKYVPVVVEDLVKPIGPKDHETAEIKNMLGKFDPTNPKYWNDDMKAVSQAWTTAQQKNSHYTPRQQTNTKPAVSKTQRRSNTQTSTETPVTLKSSYEIEGKSYTLDDLKKMGYTEEQLKEAVKMGNIK